MSSGDRKFGRTLTALLLGTLCVALATGQQPTPPDPASESPDTVIRTTVRRVALDVVVTGADRKANLGLSEKDFVVAEDGVPQRVLSFEKHDFSATDYTPPKMPPLPPNMFVDVPGGPERGPLNVILYDVLDSRMEDQLTARAQIIKFIQQMPPGARVAVFILYDRLRLLQGFTSDKAKLLAAVDSHSTWPKVEANAGNPLRGFLEMARFLNGLPGHKNLIWLSDGFPAAFSNPGFVRGDIAQDPFGHIPDVNIEYIKAIKQITNLLANGQIAVYPMDIFGMDADCKAQCLAIRTLQHEDMDSLADVTGGHAFYGTNDIKRAMDQAIEEGGSYYTLTYSSTNPNYDGKLRRIKVSVTAPEAHLAYRRTYFGTPDDPVRDQTHSAQILFSNLELGSPLMHDVLFSARVQTVAASGGNVSGSRTVGSVPKGASTKHYLVSYTVPARQFQTGSAINTAAPPLEFAIAAFDAEGVLLNGVDQHVSQDPPSPGTPAHPAKPNYIVEQEIDVAGKAKSLRIAVRNRATDQTGTLEVALPLVSETTAQTASP